jgi:hypothetical protein
VCVFSYSGYCREFIVVGKILEYFQVKLWLCNYMKVIFGSALHRCMCELNVNIVVLFDFKDIVRIILQNAGSLCHVFPKSRGIFVGFIKQF